MSNTSPAYISKKSKGHDPRAPSSCYEDSGPEIAWKFRCRSRYAAQKQFILFIEEMSHFFENRDCIVETLWELPQPNKQVEEFVYIGQVEIAR